MEKNFNILVNKLNSFRTKLYGYRLLKGLLLTLFLLVLVYTVFSLIEYFVFLSTDVRKILFFGYILFGGLLFIRFVGLPLLKLVHILKPIDIKASSQLLQNHFTDIKDKLINVIELAEIKEHNYSNDIVLASIDQKIEELKIFDFSDAVQFKNLRTILFYFLISVTLTCAIFIVNQNIFASSTHRILNYNTEFIKPAPYSFELLNTNLQAKKGDSYSISVETKGDEIPQIIYINIDGNNYLMKSAADGKFKFEIASVINPVNFYFTDLKYNSEKYTLKLLPKPGITNFNVNIFPPVYTRLQNQSFKNVGDLQVPNGTSIEWNFTGIDIDSLYFLMADSTVIPAEQEGNNFTVDSKFYEKEKYHVYIKNDITEAELALSYNIDVIPDIYPEIEVMQVKDSMELTRFFFKGIVGDDYGFSSLNFHYNVNNTDSAIAIPVVKNLIDQDFYFSFDFRELNLNSGVVSYYFSVTDNDVINGYKTTTSDNFVFEIPNQEEIAATEKEKFEKIENMMQQSEELAKDIQDDLQNLRMKNMDSNVSEWEKSQMVDDVISKQNKLEQLYNQVKQDNEELNKYLNSFNQNNEEVRKKQEQIEELLEEVFTDELKELLEEFEKLAEEFDSKKLNQLSEQMDLTYEDLQKQLDRNLEMLRKMKMEQKLQKVIDDVNEMAQEEEKMAEEVLKEKNFEEAKEQVEQHEQNLDQLQKEIEDALKMNNDLEEPMNFDDFSEEFEDVDESIENSKQELNKKNQKKSGSEMKNTSEKMKNMAFGMQQMLNSNTMEQNMENIQNLKQILSNLIHISFEQEDILDDLSATSSGDPALIGLNRSQKKIIDQSEIVKDSLYALAKRTPQITSMVNNELLSLELHLNKAADQMEEAQFPGARASQQFVITSANNLALMLNEALEQLENQMANAMPGNQSGEKQGQGKPQMNMLQQSSESIKQQLQQMIDQMKNGNSQQMGKQMGQSLMQHEMMQQMLREIMNNGQVGSSARKTLQQIDQMLEENRKQLMNKNVNAEMIARQNLITTRLLEAEQAELEREYEDKRESKTAEEFYSNPVEFFEYNDNKDFTIEYLNKNSHKLNNFYNQKYKQYLNNIAK